MKRGLMVCSMVSLVLAAVAGAAVQQGDAELNLLGGYFFENGAKGEDGAEDLDDLELGFVTGGIGYFLTDNVQVEGSGMYLYANNLSILDDVSAYLLGGKLKYHFMPTNQWVPYVGVQAFWGEFDTDNEVLQPDVPSKASLWGPIAGFRVELNATNDFFVEGQYHFWGSDIHDWLDDGFGVFFGIVHQFK